MCIINKWCWFALFCWPFECKDELQLICIPLCNSAHFQGFIIDIDRSLIIRIDSLSNNKTEDHTSQKVPNLYFESNSNVQYECLFKTREQLDSKSWGAWLVAGFPSYVLKLPVPSERNDPFEIAHSLLNMHIISLKKLIFHYLLRWISKKSVKSIRKQKFW